MKEKIAYACSIVKRYWKSVCSVNLKFTKAELAGISGGVAAIALILVLAVVVSPGGEVKPQTLQKSADIKIAEKEAVQEVYCMAVNGNEVLYVASEADGFAILDGIAKRHETPGAEIVSTGFGEMITIAKKEMNVPTVILSVEDAIQYLMTGAKELKTYTVQGGDNLWDIAAKSNLSPYELQEMNPGLDPKRLYIGQQINLVEIKPFVTVCLTERVNSTESIPYETTYQDSAELYKGQTRIQSSGASGSKEVQSEIVKQNGVVVSTIILSETVTKEPVTQIALRGTTATPVYTGASSGTLISPVGHIEVSSSYGSRGGGRHYGVDLRNPKGTPIVAAAAGVVTQSEYSGSFGKVIKIDHGGGLVTLYAHCDTILVNVGDTVAQGQQIGTVGITGNATGYHLHFEVRLNGAQMNPMNYI